MHNMTPYIFGMLHRLERQLSEIDQLQQKRSRFLDTANRDFFALHLPQMRRTAAYLRRQVILLQLATGRNEKDLVNRQVRLIYGVFTMLKPELRTALLRLHAPHSAPSRRAQLRQAAAH